MFEKENKVEKIIFILFGICLIPCCCQFAIYLRYENPCMGKFFRIPKFHTLILVFSLQVKQQRSKFKPDEVPETDEILEDRELGLDGFASEWDLQLFREAQVNDFF